MPYNEASSNEKQEQKKMTDQLKASREAIEDCLVALYKNEGIKVSREGMLHTASAINNIVVTLVPNGVGLTDMQLSIAIDNAVYRIRMSRMMA